MRAVQSMVRRYKMCGICSTVTLNDDPQLGVLSVAIPGPTLGSSTVTLQQCLVYDVNRHELLPDFNCTGCGTRGQVRETVALRDVWMTECIVRHLVMCCVLCVALSCAMCMFGCPCL
jgi:hypothetical protein